MYKFLIILLLAGCSIPNDDIVYNSFAFVYTNDKSGSGFAITDDTIITACHVIDTADRISIRTFDGETSKGIEWWCDCNADIGYIVLERKLFFEYLPIMFPKDGLREGCVYGSYQDDDVLRRCGPMYVNGKDIGLLFANSVHGMSGGPCVVEDDGDIYVIGVLYKSYQPTEEYEYKLTRRGRTICFNIAYSAEKGVINK